MNYAKHLQNKVTPQSEAIPGSTQVKNSDTGYSWAVNEWTKLDRFLILGNEGGSYYAGERKMTLDNAGAVRACLKLDGPATVRRILEISTTGRAPKNDPAILALALAACDSDLGTRQYAMDVMPQICRIGTHLFQFIEAVNGMRKWSRGLRSGVANWYTSTDHTDAWLARQVTKYQQRNGWAHRDVLRLCHAKAYRTRQAILHWAARGWPGVGEYEHPDKDLRIIWAFERAKRAKTLTEILQLIKRYDLPRECIPTQWLRFTEVWEALLQSMLPTAMIRNLGKMTANGLIAPLSNAASFVAEVLSHTHVLAAARVHPMTLLTAQYIYASGHGDKGSLTWKPAPQVIDALESAYYNSFANIEPTNKRWLLALDVSGSMDRGYIAGISGLTPRIGSAAMAMVTANSEPNYHCVAFTCAEGTYKYHGDKHKPGLTSLSISPKQRMTNIISMVSGMEFGGTDCALPMTWAAQNKVPVDVFVTYTDSESWAGPIHAAQALVQYRDKMGIGAKAIVVGMIANDFTVLDPNDAGSLNVVGFDEDAPAIMADFARN